MATCQRWQISRAECGTGRTLYLHCLGTPLTSGVDLEIIDHCRGRRLWLSAKNRCGAALPRRGAGRVRFQHRKPELPTRVAREEVPVVLREPLSPPHSRQFATQFVVRLSEVVEHLRTSTRFDFQAVVRERWNKRTSTNKLLSAAADFTATFETVRLRLAGCSRWSRRSLPTSWANLHRTRVQQTIRPLKLSSKQIIKTFWCLISEGPLPAGRDPLFGRDRVGRGAGLPSRLVGRADSGLSTRPVVGSRGS